MLHSASNKIATLSFSRPAWPGPCEKALLASGSVWPLERRRICSPLGAPEGRDSKVRKQSTALPCHAHLRWQKRWRTALTGVHIGPTHAHPNPRLKDSPPSFARSLSLFLSVSTGPTFVLSVSHLCNPGTLSQAPPTSQLRLYMFLAPSRPPLYNSAQCWITGLRGCCSEGLWQALTRMVR